MRLVQEYEDEFGEDLLETIERQEKFGEITSAEESVTNAKWEQKVGSVEDEEKRAIYSDYRRLSEEERNILSQPVVVAHGDHEEKNPIMDHEHIANVFSGLAAMRAAQSGDAGTTSAGGGGGSAGGGSYTVPSDMGKRISATYGRRFSEKELEKRTRILRELAALGFKVGPELSDGEDLNRPPATEYLKIPVPRLSGEHAVSPPDYLVSQQATRALERRERELMELLFRCFVFSSIENQSVQRSGTSERDRSVVTSERHLEWQSCIGVVEG